MSKKKKRLTKNKQNESSQTKSTNRKKGSFYLALIIAGLGFLLYANTLSHGYALDDSSAIKENRVTKLGVKGISTHLTHHYRYGYWSSAGTLYRPVSLVMFALEWQIAPDSPKLYHFINVLLYALTGFLLFLTLQKVFSGFNILLPFLVSAFFIAHPVHVEIVANIKSRDEILAFLFCISTLYYLWKHLESKNNKWLYISIGFYFLAMFSKENAITFLGVIPLSLYFFTKLDFNKIITKSALYLIPAVIFLFIRSKILGGFIGVEDVSILDNFLVGIPDASTRLASTFGVLGKYLVTLILPYQLSHDYGFNQIPAIGWGSWQAILALLIYVGMAVFAFMKLKTKHLLSFGILYFLGTFAIYSNVFFKIGAGYGERFLYFSSLGFAIVLAYLLMHFFKADFKKKAFSFNTFFTQNKSILAVASLIVLLYAVRTVTRNPVWENSLTLYENDIKIAPNCAKVRYHYGLELAKTGKDLKNKQDVVKYQNLGLEQFQEAIRIYPTYGDAYAQSGLAWYRKGNEQKALEFYGKALEHKQDAKTYSNMGIIFFSKGNLEKAKEVYEKAISLDPRYVDARRNLGSVYAQMRQFDKALEQFLAALKESPNDPTINFYLGSVYRDKGDKSNSDVYFNRAYKLDPTLRK